MPFPTLDQATLTNKIVLLRADLNVPVKDGRVSDYARIERVKPTIDLLRAQGAKIVVMAHFGRPKGQRSDQYSLSFLPPVLQTRWGAPVSFSPQTIGEDAKAHISKMNSGDILLLENVRFYAGEEKNDPEFAAHLADLGEVYVNDAFSAAHRAHASTCGIAALLPSYAGKLMQAETEALRHALEDPKKPVIAIVGGAKISTKLALLNNLVQKVDKLALGGGMANTFMYARGIEVGKSLCEKDMASEAREIMKTAEAHGCEILLPVDRVIVKDFGENVPTRIVEAQDMPADMEALDIGPKTIDLWCEEVECSKTVLWNGPLGVFEVPPFERGTNAVARAVAKETQAGHLISVAGGGDTVSALSKAGVLEAFTYISTAGGAFLEWLEGKELPGVAALKG